MSDKKTLASKIGVCMAHVQGFSDELMGLVFKSMKEKPKVKDLKKEEQNFLKRSFRNTVSFLGEMGDSFYEKYEEIKEKQKERRENEK